MCDDGALLGARRRAICGARRGSRGPVTGRARVDIPAPEPYCTPHDGP